MERIVRHNDESVKEGYIGNGVKEVKLFTGALKAFNPLAAHPAISTGNSNVAKSAHPAISAGIDESDHDSINLQSVRQWCKIDMKNIPPPPSPVLFHGNLGITVNIANNQSERTVYNPKYSQYRVSTKIVLHLMDRFLGKGYCVTIDNFYMSPQLADILVTEKTETYGTVNKTRKDLPVNFSKEKVPQGGNCCLSKRDNCSGPGRPSSTLNPWRLTARHFASHIPPNPIKKPRRQCAVCCSRKDANGKKKFAKKHEFGAKTVKLDFALKPVSNSIILN
ncbi:piggyBac transposable element-derived protein 4 [Trichonephila clavipes]|nr:piggyBac transposable element-derived protein 4 [Trichonephila clavipes]